MRYLLIGLGNIGRKRLQILGDSCIAVVDPYQPEATAKDLSEIDQKSYEAAIISTPNDSKPGILSALFQRSKPVLVDKPLRLPSADAFHELQVMAGKQGALWHTSYNHRFEPLVVRLKSELNAASIGQIYRARLFYGNGTVLNCKNTWRDSSLGVVEDLGCHLLDLAAFLFDAQGSSFRLVAAHSFEIKGYDYGLMLSEDGRIECEVSYLSWRNRFGIEVFGSEGSLHLSGLRKWGGARLEIHRRVRPSGAPSVEIVEDAGADVSWMEDQRAFEQAIISGIWDKSRDAWIASVLDQFEAKGTEA